MARDKLGATGFGWPTYKGTHWKGLNYLYFQTHGQEVDGYHLDEDGNWYDAAVDPGNKAIWATVAEHGGEQLLYPGWLTGELFDYIDQLAAGKHLSGLYKGPRPDGYMAHFEKFQAANPGATLADFPQGLHPISGPGGRAHDDAVPLEHLPGYRHSGVLREPRPGTGSARVVGQRRRAGRALVRDQGHPLHPG